jgi:Zn finger protein HypA/HybF involved in hydrogenase expression
MGPERSRLTAVHEVSLVADLITECERRAAGQQVQLVRVRHASSIAEPALRQAFRMLTENGSMAEATLDAEMFEVALTCGCGFAGALGHDDLIGGSVAVCPACGDISLLRRTAELELLEVRTVS